MGEWDRQTASISVSRRCRTFIARVEMRKNGKQFFLGMREELPLAPT